MERAAAKQLVDYLASRAGDMVRAVAFYTGDDYEILYIKDEIRAKYTEAEIERVADLLRAEPRRSRVESTFEMGEFRCSLLAFGDGIVMHFPQGGGTGTLVTLEVDAARQFSQFAAECAGRIYD